MVSTVQSARETRHRLQQVDPPHRPVDYDRPSRINRTKQYNHDTTTLPTAMSVDGDNVGEAVAVGSKQEDGHFDRFLRFIVDRSN
jgi:hypothetical protein